MNLLEAIYHIQFSVNGAKFLAISSCSDQKSIDIEYFVLNESLITRDRALQR